MRRRRILLAGPLPPPVGGDTRSFERISRSRYWEEAGLETAVLDTSRRGGVRTMHTGLDRRDLFNALSILRRFPAALRGADAAALFTNWRFLFTLAPVLAALARLGGRPVFVKPFGGDLRESFERLPAWRRWIVRRTIGRAAAIFPQVHSSCEFFRERIAGPGTEVVHLPNFVPDDFRRRERRAPEPPDGEIRCLFLGQVRDEKGVFELLEAAAGEPRIRCSFYGPRSDEDRERFDALLAAEPNATYGGVLAPERTAAVLGEHHVLVLPSRHPGEGYPAAVLEAFACGLPVIVTRWLSLPELVDDGEDGFLVPVRRPDEIRRRLLDLLEDPGLWRAMSGSAMRKAERFGERAVVGESLAGTIGRILGDGS